MVSIPMCKKGEWDIIWWVYGKPSFFTCKHMVSISILFFHCATPHILLQICNFELKTKRKLQTRTEIPFCFLHVCVMVMAKLDKNPKIIELSLLFPLLFVWTLFIFLFLFSNLWFSINSFFLKVEYIVFYGIEHKETAWSINLCFNNTCP